MSMSSAVLRPEKLAVCIRDATKRVPSIGRISELRIEPQICGVYFLISGDEVVYIGQSVDIVHRVNTHILEDKKHFDRVLYITCPVSLLDHYEKHLIAVMKPRYNRERRRIGAAQFAVQELIDHPDGLTFEQLVDHATRYGIWAQTTKSLAANIRRELDRNENIRFSLDDHYYRWETAASRNDQVQ